MRSKAIFLALLALAFGGVEAAPIAEEQARFAAHAWIARGVRGVRTRELKSHEIGRGKFYTAAMTDGSTVFLSSDDSRSPIIGYTSESIDVDKIDRNSPLWALLNREAGAPRRGKVRPSERWRKLIADGQRLSGLKLALSAPPIKSGRYPEDLRVAPLVKSLWSQSTSKGFACYNYYTPNGADVSKFRAGSASNAVCGCVATAMSQIMRYHCYPTQSIAKVTRSCSFEEKGEQKGISLTTQGGIYDWEQMTLIPELSGMGTNATMAATNYMAIGKLTSDAGISVKMMYGLNGSGAYSKDVAPALKEIWQYGQAVYRGLNITADTDQDTRDERLQHTFFANFDAGYPVVVGIPLHEIVADGYGYEDGDDFVHLNMGWAGQCDYWYNLPDMTEAGEEFIAVDDVSYNIIPDGNDKTAIISGRTIGEVNDDEKTPMPGATVSVYPVVGGEVAEEPIKVLTTPKTGVWGVVVPEGEYYIEGVAPDGKKSAEYETFVEAPGDHWGNVWGVELILKEPPVRVNGQLFYDLDRGLAFAATNENATVEILDECELRAPFTITNSCTITATNDNPWVSVVTMRTDAALSVTNGARVVFENVAFAESGKTQIRVFDGSSAVLSHPFGIARIATDAASCLEVATVITNVVEVDCAAAKAAGKAFAWSALSPTEMAESARFLLCATDDEMGGRAEDGTSMEKATAFVWEKGAPVPDIAAKAVLGRDETGEMTNYRTLAALLRHVGDKDGATTICLKADGELKDAVALDRDLTFASIGGPFAIQLAKDVNFTVAADRALAFTNITFRGGEAATALVNVEASGKFVLADGAMIDGYVGNGAYGAVWVKTGGAATMQSGATVRNCQATGNNGNALGGAFYVAGDGRLDLAGGTITGCWAVQSGGGVYAANGATVTLSGDVMVFGNTAKSVNDKRADDIYMVSLEKCPGFHVVGELTGKSCIGVRTSSDKTGNPFVSVDDASWAKRSCAAFFCDASEKFSAVVAEDQKTLCWSDRPQQVDPEDAFDKLIHNGEESYYGSFADALSVAVDGDTIVLRKQERFVRDYQIDLGLTVCSDGASAGFYRAAEVSLVVAAGGDLTLSNIVVSGGIGEKTLMKVEKGGALTLDRGATIRDVAGDGSRAAGGVTVAGGTFTMRDGAQVVNCTNSYPLNSKEGVGDANVGVGGGVLIDNGGTAYLEGGVVRACSAYRAAGVYVGNKSTVYVSGPVEIRDNLTLYGLDSNLTVEDQSQLVLTNDFVGAIGVADGISCDTNVFGCVDEAYFAEAIGSPERRAALLAGAAKFTRDFPPKASGLVVTNGENEALLVWSTAVKDGVYIDEDGNVYGVVGNPEPPSPKIVLPDPIAFTSIEKVDDKWVLVATNAKQWCWYSLWTGTTPKTNEFTMVEGTSNQWTAVDGPITNEVPVTEIPARFWILRGAPGEKPAE